MACVPTYLGSAAMLQYEGSNVANATLPVTESLTTSDLLCSLDQRRYCQTCCPRYLIH